MASNPAKKRLSYGFKDIYKQYKDIKKKEGVQVKDIIEYNKYRKIMEAFFAAVFKKIIRENFTFVMPYNLGNILVKARKQNPNKSPINFKETKKQGKLIRYTNRHTWGYVYRIKWNKEHSTFKNKNYYNFKPVRSDKATSIGVGRRALGQHILELANDPTKRSYLRI